MAFHRLLRTVTEAFLSLKDISHLLQDDACFRVVLGIYFELYKFCRIKIYENRH
jgi:hypothetical protein